MFSDGNSQLALVVMDGPVDVAHAAAEHVVARLADHADAPSVSFCLAGGTTPGLLYKELSTRFAAQLPWPRMDLYLGDERCVPADDPQSNQRMARARLLGHALGAAARVHPMYRDGEDPEAAAAAYQALLPPALDLLLLGVGPDGHICSLFPGAPALDETVRRVVAIDNAPKPPPRRITITPPVIAAARSVLVVATGREKAEAVARALADEGDFHSCPARLARHATWFIDSDAAALLARRSR